MNSAELRQSFLDFFVSKQHTVVPSASLMPSSPNLLFTNAGMNQFVPYFLGEREPAYTRAVDTQKCIRAGGKHNDLEDVGFDTYHHTFFEMLGNWSFGDYFKEEVINFSWELLTEVWKFPKERLYATVYQPGEGDPADFDQEAYGYWETVFKKAGLDPKKHIRTGDKKDNFWMMGETGPCGPCSELHIDLTPNGDTGGELVNADSPWCIEIWNLVFIQFNAEEDGSFISLPARHVDTGMGFERVAGIMTTTKGFTDFSNPPSNYNSDLFTEIFDHLSKHCAHRYAYTMPENRDQMNEEEQKDCAFRVIADHIRTLSFSIADGILPGNEGRNYVLRRILRRAVMFGKRLELPSGFFAELAPVLIAKMGEAFPELVKQQTVISKVISSEEKAFEKTIDRGLQQFSAIAENAKGTLSGEDAFTLYDTYGFPLDLTELLARERGLTVDSAGFEAEMEKQRARGRASQQKTTIRLSSGESAEATRFLGFDAAALEGSQAKLQEIVELDGNHYLVFDQSPFYAEMGGQLGDIGTVRIGDQSIEVTNTIKDPAGRSLHAVAGPVAAKAGSEAVLTVDIARRSAIHRHHSATHILNWALRQVLGDHIRQAGSLVTPDRLRFDFAHYEAISALQIAEIERLVNDAILANGKVGTYESAFDAVPDDVVAVFGEKYGDTVRVVDIGGFSKELCGGTHVAATGEIGLCKIVAESGIAAGTRRIEAICGESAYRAFEAAFLQQQSLAKRLVCKPEELSERLATLLEQRDTLEKDLRKLRNKAAAEASTDLVSDAAPLGTEGLRWVKSVVEAGSPNELRSLGAQLLSKLQEGVVVLGAVFDRKISVVALASPAAIQQGYRAGDIIRNLTQSLGGKGGGKPDFAMGGAADNGKLRETLEALSLQ